MVTTTDEAERITSRTESMHEWSFQTPRAGQSVLATE